MQPGPGRVGCAKAGRKRTAWGGGGTLGVGRACGLLRQQGGVRGLSEVTRDWCGLLTLLPVTLGFRWGPCGEPRGPPGFCGFGPAGRAALVSGSPHSTEKL